MLVQPVQDLDVGCVTNACYAYGIRLLVSGHVCHDLMWCMTQSDACGCGLNVLKYSHIKCVQRHRQNSGQGQS